MIGNTFAQYRVLEKIGQGGMGVVYLAHDLKLERKVALKFLPPEVAEDPLARERFRREALAAAAIDHPFLCHIHEIGEVDGLAFIAMEYVDGETLRARLKKGPLPLAEALRIAEEIAGALAEAHERGIVHRDLKPSNIMLTSDGHAKVMDFGLAKVTLAGGSGEDADDDISALTATGVTTGTPQYMSPEQIEGDPVDARSDLFAFAVVFYELTTGRHPFEKGTPLATTTAILTETPSALRGGVAGATRELDDLLSRMLARDPASRVQSAAEIRDALRELQQRYFSAGAGRRTRLLAGAATAVALLAGAALFLPYRARVQAERAQARIAEVEALAFSGRYVDAYALTGEIARYVPGDSTLAALRPLYTDRVSVTSEPEGAQVYIQRVASDESGTGEERQVIGPTPVVDLELPRGEYKAWIELDGFDPLELMLSSELNRAEARFGIEPWMSVDVELLPTDGVPEDMVFVPGGDYTPIGWRYLGSHRLSDFFIDRYEVSNADYREFIRAGGYTNRAYWTQPIVDGERELSIEEAMVLLTDRSGLPGPREWTNQEFPEGEERHPVTGVSWYEAAAYAEYVDKSLPTVYQWEKAARNGLYTHFEGMMMPWGLVSVQSSSADRANFFGRGPVAVDAYPFGVSPFGAYNMAGNVAEWTRNERGEGYATLGGSWVDPSYLFSSGGSRPGIDASNTVGFRLVQIPGGEPSNQGSEPLVRPRSAEPQTPVDDATFEALLTHYRYDRAELDVEITERLETPDWVRERITFDGVEDRAIAYLYLPRRAEAPYQVIDWIASGTVLQGRTVAEEVEAILTPQIKAGRAVLAVVPRGARERPWDAYSQDYSAGTVLRRDMRVIYVTEFRIGLDYLETRPDIDMTKVAHVGFSWGALGAALILDAVEPRIRTNVYMGGGIQSLPQLPEANEWNFVTRIRQPTLVLTGRFDEEMPYDPLAKDLYEILEAPKRLELVDSGHLPPLEIRNPIIASWLDEILGPVSR